MRIFLRMADNTAAGASPATTETETPASPEVLATPSAFTRGEDPKELTDVLSQLSATPDQLRQLATGADPRKVFDVKEPTPAPVAEETPAAEEPEATTTEEETVEETTTEEEAPAPEAEAAKPGKKAEPSRFRFATEEDRTVALLAKTLNVSLVEAAKRYETMKTGNAPAASTPATPAAEAETFAPPPAPPELADIDQQVTIIEDRIKTLNGLRAKAMEEFDNAKIIDLSDQIADAKLDKATLAHRKESISRQVASTHENAYKSAAEKSRDAAYVEFPSLADAKSKDRRAFNAYVAEVQADPARANTFNSPSWPLKLAREFDAEVGLTKATPGKPATPAVKPAAPKPKATIQQVPGAKLNNGADGTNPSASRPPMTEAQAFEDLSKLSASERLKLVRLL